MDSSYKKYTDKRAPKSPILKNCVMAFFVGGTICTVGQLFRDLYTELGISEEKVKLLIPVTLIVITAVLTGFGVFDKVAKRAGAGTLVPITGFANSVVAPALDNKAEGWIFGLGAKIFIISGPVILYGTMASVVYGVIYYIVSLL